jgi:ribonucleoside-diphosphate reductase alpha chain
VGTGRLPSQVKAGRVIFEQKDVEVPRPWSMTATNIVASKYFHGTLGTPERETSVRQLIGRVATQITKWGIEGGYFASEHDSIIFHDELVYLLVNQHMAFNSPVWFNCGVEVRPQCSACFINSVDDTMTSIPDLAKMEGMFRAGIEIVVMLRSVLRKSSFQAAASLQARCPL